MNKVFRLLCCSAVVLLAAVSTASAEVAPENARPNIVLIVADDLGYGDVGYLGSRDIRTPNIDALAASGVVMRQGYVTASICSPSRAGMLTGRYQQEFGHENNIAGATLDPAIGLPATLTTMADVMRGAGYATAAIGKWHLGAAPQYHPNARGFDEFFGFLGGKHLYRSAGGGANALQRNGVAVPLSGYLTDVFADEAVAYMGRQAGPFFLYMAFNAPHSPLDATEKYLQRYPKLNGVRRTYAAMVSALDDGVGRIVATAAGLSRPTVIVFLSDNGAVPKWGGSNGSLRGEKGTAWDGGIRVPFIVRVPGVGAGTYQQPVMSFDLLPTFAALAGADVPPAVDGVNLLPYLRGTATGQPHDALFWRLNGNAPSAARQGNLKTVAPGTGGRVWLDMSDQRERTAAMPSVELLDMFHQWESGLMSPRWGDSGD